MLKVLYALIGRPEQFCKCRVCLIRPGRGWSFGYNCSKYAYRGFLWCLCEISERARFVLADLICVLCSGYGCCVFALNAFRFKLSHSHIIAHQLITHIISSTFDLIVLGHSRMTRSQPAHIWGVSMAIVMRTPSHADTCI